MVIIEGLDFINGNIYYEDLVSIALVSLSVEFASLLLAIHLIFNPSVIVCSHLRTVRSYLPIKNRE